MKRNLKLGEAAAPYKASPQMIRTQIYLSREEHEFLNKESARLNQPMAGLIRSFIDEKMNVPEAAWEANPLLEETPVDPNFQGQPDSSLNHDHYAYGAPKRYAKKNGKWVESRG